jgi:arylsulfatase A
MGMSFWVGGVHGKPSFPFHPVPLPLLNGTTVIEQPADLSNLVKKYVGFASNFIARHTAAKRPWYLYVPFNHIHSPNSCSAEWCGKSKRGPVGDATEELDSAVGEIMKAVKEAGCDENTITFFTSVR